MIPFARMTSAGGALVCPIERRFVSWRKQFFRYFQNVHEFKISQFSGRNNEVLCHAGGVDPVTTNREIETTGSVLAKPASDTATARRAAILKILPTAPNASADRTPAPKESLVSQIDTRDSFSVTAFSDIIDRSLHAAVARYTAGLSPAALAQAYLDWATHLAFSPGKRWQLVDKATRKTVRFANYASRGAALGRKAPWCIEPLPQDRRFRGEAWQKWPYNVIQQAFLLNQQWWYNATTGVRGVTNSMRAWSSSRSRQILDMFSPSNFILTNPEVLRHTDQQGRHESRERCRESSRGLGTRHERQEARRDRKFRGRPQRRGHTGQGDISQSADRAHPVRAGNRQGPAGAGPDRAGLDHEILHSRSVARQFAGEISHATGLYGFHDLLEEP